MLPAIRFSTRVSKPGSLCSSMGFGFGKCNPGFWISIVTVSPVHDYATGLSLVMVRSVVSTVQHPSPASPSAASRVWYLGQQLQYLLIRPTCTADDWTCTQMSLAESGVAIGQSHPNSVKKLLYDMNIFI